MVRYLILAVCVLALAGCRLFWVKPGGNVAAFRTDHEACARSAGTPASGDLVTVNLEAYKACLTARGWKSETGSRFGNPPGYFRGLDRPGPVKPDELPRQVRTMERR